MHISMVNSRLAVAFIAFVFVSACAQTEQVKPAASINETRILEAIDKSARVIADAQRIAAESQNALRAITMTAEQREAYKNAIADVPPNLDRPVSIFVKNEELEMAARMLAILTDYDFNVVNPGARPRDGVLITVESKGRSGYDVARDIGTQAGIRADLNVVPYPADGKKTSKFGLIEVVYK